jgi:hypothetical protein
MEFPTCSICLDYMTINLATTQCGHVFHIKWYYILLNNYSLQNTIIHKQECPYDRQT